MATESFTSIPRINLSLALDPDSEASLLSQLRYALTEVGFLYVENHGVAEKVIGDLVDILPVLFGLTAENKAEVALDNSPHFLGYSDEGSEMTAGKADQREQFELANELTATWKEGLPLYERLRGPNQVCSGSTVMSLEVFSSRVKSGHPDALNYSPSWKRTSRR